LSVPPELDDVPVDDVLDAVPDDVPEELTVAMLVVMLVVTPDEESDCSPDGGFPDEEMPWAEENDDVPP
jgi:hypothetical protein